MWPAFGEMALFSFSFISLVEMLEGSRLLNIGGIALATAAQDSSPDIHKISKLKSLFHTENHASYEHAVDSLLFLLLAYIHE